VALPYYDLGWQGADMLDQLVQGKGSETERRILKCLVIPRQSSARPGQTQIADAAGTRG
jgi:LacI family transcriptional regulator